jgi:hypothetical protein
MACVFGVLGGGVVGVLASSGAPRARVTRVGRERVLVSLSLLFSEKGGSSFRRERAVGGSSCAGGARVCVCVWGGERAGAPP